MVQVRYQFLILDSFSRFSPTFWTKGSSDEGLSFVTRTKTKTSFPHKTSPGPGNWPHPSPPQKSVAFDQINYTFSLF